MKKSRIIYPKHRLYKARHQMAVKMFMDGLRRCFRIGFKWGHAPGTKDRLFEEMFMLDSAIVHVQWNNPDHTPSESEVQVINEVAEHFSQERIKRNEEHN